MKTNAEPFLNESILNEGNWLPRNRERLISLIKEKAFQDNYAVFDWDFTCIFYDTQDSIFNYQLENLLFKLNPKEFSKTIREEVPQNLPFKEKFCLEGQSLTAAALSKDLDERYSFIYKNYKGFEGSLSLEEITATEEYLDFKAKLICLAFGAENLNGRDLCQSVSTGFTEEELSALAEEAIDSALKDEIKLYTIESSKSLKGAAGLVQANYRKGIRIQPELQELFAALRKHKIEVYICTASQETGVRVFATHPKYGYCLKSDAVIGQRRILIDGKISDTRDKRIPITYREGKAQTIERLISPRHNGKPPILIGGDSDGDFYMMDRYKDDAVLLIFERDTLHEKQIMPFIEEAKSEKNPNRLVQLRNTSTGLFQI